MKKRRRMPTALVGATWVLAMSTPASLVAQATTTLDITATVTAASPTCSFTVPPADWGTWELGGVTPNVDAVFEFDCTGPVANATYAVDGGLSPTGVFHWSRAMRNGTDTFRYAFIDVATATSVAPGQIYSISLPAGPYTRSFVATSQTGVPVTNATGIYTDQLVVTVTF